MREFWGWGVVRELPKESAFLAALGVFLAVLRVFLVDLGVFLVDLGVFLVESPRTIGWQPRLSFTRLTLNA